MFRHNYYIRGCYMKKSNSKRFNIVLPKSSYLALKKLAKSNFTTMSEIVRQSILLGLKSQDQNQETKFTDKQP